MLIKDFIAVLMPSSDGTSTYKMSYKYNLFLFFRLKFHYTYKKLNTNDNKSTI